MMKRTTWRSLAVPGAIAVVLLAAGVTLAVRASGAWFDTVGVIAVAGLAGGLVDAA